MGCQSQGSVVDPLLFLLYIIDLPQYLTDDSLAMFDEDTTITISEKNINKVDDKLKLFLTNSFT